MPKQPDEVMSIFIENNRTVLRTQVMTIYGYK